MISTPSSAQTGKQPQDTVKCYGLTELRYIATTMVEGKTCDTLLSIAKQKLANRDTLIQEKELEISKLNREIRIKDSAITTSENTIREINLNLDTEKTKNKWFKYGWIATSVFLGGVIVYVAGR